jgi:hypothetical protein
MHYLRGMEWCRNGWNEFFYSLLSEWERSLLATADRKWCCCGGDISLRGASEEEEGEEEDDGFCYGGILVTIPCSHVFGL